MFLLPIVLNNHHLLLGDLVCYALPNRWIGVGVPHSDSFSLHLVLVLLAHCFISSRNYRSPWFGYGHVGDRCALCCAV